jgi:hypothetical protein
LSPSDGGSGTCSWHGGIMGNDNDGGGGWSVPDIGGSDGIEMDDDTMAKLFYGGIGLLAVWWLAKNWKDINPPKDDGAK